MKLNKRIFVLLLTVILVFTSTASVFAQTADPAAVLAGDTVSVVFAYENISGINGTFTYSNSSIIENVEISQEILKSGETNGPMIGGKVNEELKVTYFQANVGEICEITLDITIADTAKAGDSCTITFEYETTVDGDLPSVPEYSYDYATITVGSPVDYTELNNQIEIAEWCCETEHLYTLKSWEASNIESLLNDAIAARESDDQDEVDAAALALKNAIASLVKMNLDYLRELMEKAESFGILSDDQGNYTNDSWNALLRAYSKGGAALDSRDQETVDKAAEALAAAIEALTEIDYSELNNQIERAEGLDKDIYTEESWKAVEDALIVAKAALSSLDQAEVDAAAAALKTAIDNLEEAPVIIPVDYTELNKQIRVAEGLTESDYTAESWAKMTEALKAAKAALESDDQSVVDAAAAALEAAIAALEKAPVIIPVDYTELNKQIGIAEGLIESDYTAESWAKMTEALKAAKAALESDDQGVVDAAAAALRDAIEALQIPPTGDTFALMLTLSILAALATVIMFVVRSKKRLRVK